jgi:hypothetical protein
VTISHVERPDEDEEDVAQDETHPDGSHEKVERGSAPRRQGLEDKFVRPQSHHCADAERDRNRDHDLEGRAHRVLAEEHDAGSESLQGDDAHVAPDGHVLRVGEVGDLGHPVGQGEAEGHHGVQAAKEEGLQDGCR